MKKQNHFLNIPAKATRDPKAPYAILPVPYEKTVSYGTGTARGPAAILHASQAVEDYDEELNVPVNLAVQTLKPPSFRRLTDSRALAAIKSAALPVMKDGRFLLSLGGEHTITGPLAAAAKEAFGKICILHIDAHLDLRDKFSGTRLSHGCVMRRAREMGISTVHVGIRSCCREEAAYIKKEDIPIFWAKDICKSSGTNWIKNVIRNLRGRVYLSVDIDGLDCALVQGTGTPEPGGMSWYQLIALIRQVMSKKQVIGADIVETAPMPGSQVSEFVAARLGLKILLYHKHFA